jgi:hypothetical protein
MQMNNNANNRDVRKKLAEEAGIILTKRGTEGYRKAREIVLSEKIEYKTVREAMRYFMQCLDYLRTRVARVETYHGILQEQLK